MLKASRAILHLIITSVTSTALAHHSHAPYDTSTIITIEGIRTIHTYRTFKRPGCPLKAQCTTGDDRKIERWEHEAVLEAAAAEVRKHPELMRLRHSGHGWGVYEPMEGHQFREYSGEKAP